MRFDACEFYRGYTVLIVSIGKQIFCEINKFFIKNVHNEWKYKLCKKPELKMGPVNTLYELIRNWRRESIEYLS